MRPNGDPASASTVCPGLHVRGAGSDGLPGPAVVWWDPRKLKLDAEPPLGIRNSQLIVRDVAPEIVDAGLADYGSWRAGNEKTIAAGSQPSVDVQTVTRWAKIESGKMELPPVEVVEAPRDENRPSGPRFGALVHTVLGTVPLDGDADAIRCLATAHGRTLGATGEEVECAAKVVQTVLAQPILQRARDAAKESRCRREVPVTWREPGGELLEGVIDLAFRDDKGWTIVDFKTDEEFRRTAHYGRQVRLYGAAVSAATDQMTSAILMRI
jgi:ATP-dependent helicase/nuclease subunit A